MRRLEEGMGTAKWAGRMENEEGEGIRMKAERWRLDEEEKREGDDQMDDHTPTSSDMEG